MIIWCQFLWYFSFWSVYMWIRYVPIVYKLWIHPRLLWIETKTAHEILKQIIVDSQDTPITCFNKVKLYYQKFIVSNKFSVITGPSPCIKPCNHRIFSSFHFFRKFFKCFMPLSFCPNFIEIKHFSVVIFEIKVFTFSTINHYSPKNAQFVRIVSFENSGNMILIELEWDGFENAIGPTNTHTHTSAS